MKHLNEKQPILTQVEMNIYIKLSQYLNLSDKELFEKFEISSSSKSRFNLLAAKMLGLKGSINSSSIFTEANLILKTVRVEENDKIKEHMSFSPFSFTKIVTESWETSDFRKLFLNNTFIFLVFKKKNDAYYFNKIKFWNMPEIILEGPVKNTWCLTKNLIENGEIVKSFDGSKYKTNFPGSTFNKICHVRPHDAVGIEKGKGSELPFPDKLTGFTKYTKHCFWLDNSYISNIIND